MPSAGVDVVYSLEAANAQLGTKTLRCWSTQVLEKVQQLIPKHRTAHASFNVHDLKTKNQQSQSLRTQKFIFRLKAHALITESCIAEDNQVVRVIDSDVLNPLKNSHAQSKDMGKPKSQRGERCESTGNRISPRVIR